MSTADIIARCEALYEDLDFTAARKWKEADPSRKVLAYMPVYVPREIIHAAGMLPLGIMGGGDGLEVIHGDAYYQSYICRIPRSTLELGLTGRLDCLDGMLFPSICDVSRASLRIALYNNQSTDGTKPDTPAKRASASSACRLRSVNTSCDRGGSDGGKVWGTNARTDSPSVVEIE